MRTSHLAHIWTSLLAAACQAGAQHPSAEHLARGDDVRIEHEAKLKVPLDQRDALWEWLQQRYADCTWLDREERVFGAAFGVEDFTDIYYDTPNLRMLAQQCGIRHRIRTVHSGPATEKDGRELLQIKVNRGDATGLARSEIKFSVPPGREVKRLGDAYPFVGLVQPEERRECEDIVRALGIDPRTLQPILVLNQSRRRIYLNDDQGALATLTLDLCTISDWGAHLRWAECELELNEIRFTDADGAEREYMVQVLERIQRDLQQAFPTLTGDQTPKYNTSFAAVEAATWLPVRQLIRWRMEADEFILLVLIGVVASGGAAVYGAAAWRRRVRIRPASPRAS